MEDDYFSEHFTFLYRPECLTGALKGNQSKWKTPDWNDVFKHKPAVSDISALSVFFQMTLGEFICICINMQSILNLE